MRPFVITDHSELPRSSVHPNIGDRVSFYGARWGFSGTIEGEVTGLMMDGTLLVRRDDRSDSFRVFRREATIVRRAEPC